MSDAGKTFDVTEDTFQAEVLDSALPVLIDFWAEWCGPCKMIEPHVVAIAGEYEDQLRVGRVDADANGRLLMQFGIMGIPTLILFKGGQEVARVTGFMPKDRLLSQISPHL